LAAAAAAAVAVNIAAAAAAAAVAAAFFLLEGSGVDSFRDKKVFTGLLLLLPRLSIGLLPTDNPEVGGKWRAGARGERERGGVSVTCKTDGDTCNKQVNDAAEEFESRQPPLTRAIAMFGMAVLVVPTHLVV
jgi:hypothetical protein